MDAYRTLVLAHALFGTAALLTFWSAAFARKGGPLHRGSGKVYLLAMVGVTISAVPITAMAFARGQDVTGTFLAYLVLITATVMWQGWRAVRRKRDQAAFRDRAYLAVALLNLVASVAVFAAGWRVSQPLLMGFSLVGAATGVEMLYRRARPLQSARWWLKEHYSAMMGCGVATHVAFLSIGLNRIVQALGFAPPSWYSLIAWFGPLLASLAAVAWLDRKYFADGRAPAIAAPRQV